MAGFAAALGGIGTELHDYGQQMRQILESRRDLFAQMAQKRAEEETDPSMRDQWTQAAASALSGKDFGQILPRLIKAHDAHQQSTQVLGQIAQASGAVPPTPPAPTPGPGSGIPNGNIPTDVGPIEGISPGPAGQDFSSLLAKAAPETPPAAQTTATAVPTTEGKIQVPAQSTQAPVALAAAPAPAAPPASAAPTITGLPTPEDPAHIVQDVMSNPLWAAPANRPALIQGLQQRLSHQEALRQAIETKQTELAYKRSAVDSMKKSGVWSQMPAWMQNAYEAEAGGLPAVSIGSSMTPHALSTTLGSTAPPGTMEFGTNKPVDPKTLYDVKYIPGYDQTIWQPAAPKVGLTDTAAGGKQVTNLQTGDAIAPATGAVAPIQIAPIVGVGSNGGPAITSAAGAAAGIAPISLSVTPAGLAPTETKHSSVTLPDGTTITATESKKVALPGKIPVEGQTPVPATQGIPHVPISGDLPVQKTVAPFNPANRLDGLIQQVANGDQTMAQVATNQNDKYNIQERMAQLGLTPANITSSMRERAKNARLILGHLDQISGIIGQAEKDGDLGVVATRWNDFLTNKLGADPTKDQTFAKLSSELGFLSTAVSMAHGGMRGGSSPTMVEHWEKALDAKDPTTLKAKLGEAKKWMEGYSRLDQGLADHPNQVITPASGAPSIVNDLIRDYAPKK